MASATEFEQGRSPATPLTVPSPPRGGAVAELLGEPLYLPADLLASDFRLGKASDPSGFGPAGDPGAAACDGHRPLLLGESVQDRDQARVVKALEASVGGGLTGEHVVQGHPVAERGGFLGVYTDPNHIVAYADGEIRQQYETTYIGRPVNGEPTVNDEADAVRFVQPVDLAQYAIHRSMRHQIGDYLAGTYPYLG
ncbi:hypothetical protein AB0D08_04905 [Kitasatospora sp. NPDC048540]|uniref:hypothetical protein n=1 Tax=Kitasatospora sp. NPDC048540 TaxID=3155634 RepID=UPI0033FC664E